MVNNHPILRAHNITVQAYTFSSAATVKIISDYIEFILIRRWIPFKFFCYLEVGIIENCIYSAGDLQRKPTETGKQDPAGGFIEEAWQQFKNEWQASKNPWGLGLGDYDDWLRPSLRPLLNSALGKDDSARAVLDTMVLKSHDETIKSMQFMDRRLIGLHEGHHVHYLAGGTNTDQRLSSALHATFLGFSATHRMALSPNESGVNSRVITMVSMHGNAGGRKVNSALAFLGDNFANAWIADIFAMGHGCKNGNMVPFERQTIRRDGSPGIIRSIPRCLVVGGFSRGYTDGWKSDYIERAGMTPQPLGWAVIKLRPTWYRHRPELGLGSKPNRHGRFGVDIEVVNRFFTEEQDS